MTPAGEVRSVRDEAAAAAATVPDTRSDAASVLGNSASSSAAQAVTAVASYALLYLTGVLLGRIGVGEMGVVLGVVILGQMIAVLGTDLHMARAAARRPDSSADLLGQALTLSALGSIPVIALALILAVPGAGHGNLAAALVIGSLAIAPGAMAVACEGLFMGRERIRLTGLSNTIEGLVRLVIATALLLAGWGIVGLAAAVLAGRALALGVDLFLIRRRLGVTPRIHGLGPMRATLIASLPFWGLNAMLALFGRGDILVLSRLAGDAEAGLFVAGFRPVELISILPMSMLWGLYPVLSRQLAGGGELMRRGLEHAFLLIAALMVGIAIGLAFEADTAVRILFPASLEPAAGVLSILAFTLLPLCLEVVTASLILAQGRTTLALGTVACGLVVLGVLNVWLDPKYGAIGAAWARLAATILIATLNAAFALRGFGSHWLMRRLAGVALGAFLLGATLWVTRSAPLLAIPLGTVVYLAAMLLTGVVTRSDLTMVRHVLARRT